MSSPLATLKQQYAAEVVKKDADEKLLERLKRGMWTLRDLAEPAGTGPGVAPVVDSSITVAQELFAPYSEDLFSPELDVQALKGMLTQPLTIQVPVASNILAQ
ncbi:TPA: hypothetical protein ACH3X1_016663 [Trebouxia sp. C0004]